MVGFQMYGFRPLLIVAGATTVCCFGAYIVEKLSRRRSKRSYCACCAKVKGEIRRENGEMGSVPMDVEAREGASMMEQLVPEITTHTLSYLDYTSLCRLSMTNSAMRRAANDDGAWKALYQKDFTVEQRLLNPRNGWKAYYAVTREIININAEFYNIIRERTFSLMSRFWLNADYVNCTHASGEFFSGYREVMDSWGIAFNWGQGEEPGHDFQIQEVRARLVSDMAWLTVKLYLNNDANDSFHVTNVYERHNNKWYMVHHHSSPVLNLDDDHEFI